MRLQFAEIRGHTLRMAERSEDWPLGAYLRRAREDHEPRLSIRQAAAQAGISEGRWRQLEAGYQSVGRGQRLPVNTKPVTLHAMAKGLGLPDARPLFQAVGMEYDRELEEGFAEFDDSDAAAIADAVARADAEREPSLESLRTRLEAARTQIGFAEAILDRLLTRAHGGS